MTSASVVMITKVITVTTRNTAKEAIETLFRHKISGAPVLDDDRRFVGIISECQLLGVIYDEWLQDATVEDLMATDVISISEDTPVTEVAEVLITHRIRRVPVVKQGRLVGLISRRDLMNFAVCGPQVLLDEQTLLRLATPRKYPDEIVAPA